MKKRVLKSFYQKKQEGAVLAFCLIFLGALTVIAVGNMEGTIMEERMAGNMQDYNLAFQAAEASLDAAETWLAGQTFEPETAADGSETVWTGAGLDPDTDTDDWWDERTQVWWDANADSATDIMAGVAQDPQYIIEEFFSSSQGQARNIGTSGGVNVRTFHRVTSRGVGGSNNSQVMLQTTYVRPYD